MKNNNQINILVITNMYPGKNSPSFGVFIKNQVESLRKRGVNVDVIGIRDHRMGTFFILKKYMLWTMKILLQIVKRKQYQIVHCHYVFPSGLFGLIFQRLFNSKLVVTAHGGDIDKMARKNPFIFNQTRKILQKANIIIVVGKKLKKDIISDFKIDKKKILVVNMGVDRQIFTPLPKDEAKAKLNLSKHDWHILFVGNLIKAKGLDELIMAFNQLKKEYPNLQLHLIGANKEPVFLAKLQKRIKEESIEDVHFYPPMKQEDIAIWMSAADVYVLPSYIEGFGLSALEAMSCHTPVVGTDVGGLSHLLDQDAGVLVKPHDVDSLKAGIERVLKDEKLREKLIMNGEKKAQNNSEEKQIDTLLEIYKSLLSN